MESYTVVTQHYKVSVSVNYKNTVAVLLLGVVLHSQTTIYI